MSVSFTELGSAYNVFMFLTGIQHVAREVALISGMSKIRLIRPAGKGAVEKEEGRSRYARAHESAA